MAVVKLPQTSAIVLKLQTGINSAGNPVYKLVKYGNVKSAAPDDALYSVASKLAALQSHQLSSIQRVDTANLANQ